MLSFIVLMTYSYRTVNGTYVAVLCVCVCVCVIYYPLIHRVSKTVQLLFLSELRQISTKFDNFWQNDG